MDNPIVRSIQQKLDKIDKSTSHAIFSKAQRLSPRLKPYLIFLEWSCNGIIWLSLSILWILFNQQQSPMIPKLLIGLIVDVFYVAIIKALARRRRPAYAYQRDQLIVASVDKHSFPSGHCSRSTYVALFANLYFHSTAPLVSFVVTLWAISICISRVLLGRHHILDCFAGAALGWLNFTIQFRTFIPVNAIGMFLIRAIFGSKSFGDRNDVDDAETTIE